MAGLWSLSLSLSLYLSCELRVLLPATDEEGGECGSGQRRSELRAAMYAANCGSRREVFKSTEQRPAAEERICARVFARCTPPTHHNAWVDVQLRN